EEARRRVDLFPAETIFGIPFIFQELPDGSQRLVRDDGKPLQWHRPSDDSPPIADQPIPVSDDPCESSSGGRPAIRVIPLHPDRMAKEITDGTSEINEAL